MNRYVVVLLILSGMMIFPFMDTLYVSANPIYVDEYDWKDGSYLLLTENISMPEARVHLIVNPFHGQEIEIRGSYTLISNSNLSAVAAFVYPENWHLPRSSDNCEGSCNLKITIDDEAVEYIISDSTDIINNTLEYPSYWQEMDDLCFAVFNLTLEEGKEVCMKVIGKTIFFIPIDTAFTFEYYIGSAYSWYGETHEVITLEARDIQPFTRPMSGEIRVWNYLEFFPDWNLEVSKNSTWTKAVWNLTLSTSTLENQTYHDYMRVGFTGWFFAPWYPSTYDIYPDTSPTSNPIVSTEPSSVYQLDTLTLSIIGIVSAVTVILIAVVITRRYKT